MTLKNQKPKDHTVNRYIVALLVVLAATGTEAQTSQMVLKRALSDISEGQILNLTDTKALENDLLSVIRALQEPQKEENTRFGKQQQNHAGNLALIVLQPSVFPVFFVDIRPIINPQQRVCYDSIIIRGPDMRGC